MSDPVSSPLRRYRRRILGWGLLAVAVLCGAAAPLFLRSVERDLERRVPSELADDGFDGVTAAFSGQDGVLSCAAPLAEPEDAIDAAIDIWGVRAIELDRSCRVGGSPSDDTGAASTASTSPSDGETVPSSSTPPASTTTTDEAPDFATIVDVVASGPRLSILESLIDEADAAETLSGSGPFTLFAPSDEAFDALPADTLAELRQDPVQLAEFLQHHVVAGSNPSNELEPGVLEMLDGMSLNVAVDDDQIRIGGALVTEPDLVAGNGVVHVIDEVLLPGPDPTEPDDRVAVVSATLTAGRIVLAGEVADEAQRALLVEGATRVLDPANVDDQLAIAPDATIDDDTVRSLAELVAVMPPHLVSGESGFDGTGLYAEGVFVDNSGRSAFLAVADFVAAVVEVAPRPTASDADAASLEDELNAFVLANPIQFAPASADVAPEALAVLDQIAGIVERFDGVTITIEGHTDSDGVPAENQVLSEQRAVTVLAGLVERGVPFADLAAVGLGSTQPILVGGVEDKDASRRIEFRVTTGPGA
ncbi:MAG TPA: fasciclin domain-containing protein [Ilumatobacteraceae bacterium]|nr:fasciclin domain-containing protein [Ilumatobacteraceae bacterium]